jgi:ribosomal protein S18 acetylase RimI-like enzyme
MSSVYFRNAEVSDVFQIASIHVESAKLAYRDFISRPLLDDVYNVKYKRKLWEKVIVNDPNSIIVVSNEMNKIIGFAYFEVLCESEKNLLVELHTLYIAPAYFLQGIGAALVQRMLDNLKLHDEIDVFLWVLDKNVEAKKFYFKWGFKEAAEQRICDDIPEAKLSEVKLIRSMW